MQHRTRFTKSLIAASAVCILSLGLSACGKESPEGDDVAARCFVFLRYGHQRIGRNRSRAGIVRCIEQIIPQHRHRRRPNGRVQFWQKVEEPVFVPVKASQ